MYEPVSALSFHALHTPCFLCWFCHEAHVNPAACVCCMRMLHAYTHRHCFAAALVRCGLCCLLACSVLAEQHSSTRPLTAQSYARWPWKWWPHHFKCCARWHCQCLALLCTLVNRFKHITPDNAAGSLVQGPCLHKYCKEGWLHSCTGLAHDSAPTIEQRAGVLTSLTLTTQLLIVKLQKL